MSTLRVSAARAFLGETLHRHRPAVRLDGPALPSRSIGSCGASRGDARGTSTSSTGGSSTSSRSITLSPARSDASEALLVDEGARRELVERDLARLKENVARLRPGIDEIERRLGAS